MPDLTKLQGNINEYVEMRRRLDDHYSRALGCWGLIARWPASREAVETLLQSGSQDDIEDAGGILSRVGIPEDMLQRVLEVVDSLPDSTARDCLVQSLPVGHPRKVPDAAPVAMVSRALADVPLGGAWEPYTGRIQFIELPFQAVVKAVSPWVRRSNYQGSRHNGSLATLMPLLDPYWIPDKRLFVETRADWTAVFSNGHDTYEAEVLSGRMGVRGVATAFSVDVVSHGEIQNYGNALFEAFDHGESVRTIQVSRQTSGWEFVLLGSELPFEETARYGSKIKRERFDLEMINRYCAALGIARSDAGFYGPRALLHIYSARIRAWQRLWRRPSVHPLYATAAAWRAAHLTPR